MGHLSASWAETFLSIWKLRSVPVINPWLIPLFQTGNKARSPATASQFIQVPEVLQHHIPVKGPLARTETLPFFPAEVHSHVSEGHWHRRSIAVSSLGKSAAPSEAALSSSFAESSSCSKTPAHLKAAGDAGGRVGFSASAVARSRATQSSTTVGFPSSCTFKRQLPCAQIGRAHV